MKLPFVSRLAFELLAESRERETRRLQEECAALRGQLHDMTVRYHTLRLMGQAPVETFTPTPVVEDKEPDDVIAAIHEEAAGDPVRLAMMLRQARLDRAMGVPDEEIIAAVRNGIRPDGVPI